MLSNVSVIIPAYNVENSLKNCIDSVLYQSLPAAEIFVINDGSTDDTAKIAQSYGNKIIYLEQPNQGQGAARNAGLEKATGDFIAFLDADDYWLPDFLKTCVDFLNTNLETVAVWTAWINIIDEKERVVVPPIIQRQPRKYERPQILDNFFRFWADNGHLQTGAITIRHETVKKAGFQRSDLRNSQDLEYWALIATHGKWGFIPVPLYVNNSRLAARGKWREKYKTRRQLCPDVETWEERLIPRLKPEDIAGFEVVRGNVAAGYAHGKILGGNFWDGLRIVKKYGHAMPPNNLNNLMKIGARLGKPGWILVCIIIQAKELYKDWRMR